MSRKKVLSRIKTATQSGARVDLPNGYPTFPEYSDPIAQFRSRLEAEGGTFFDARSERGVAGALTSILRTCRCEAILWESKELFAKHDIEVVLPEDAPAADCFLESRHRNKEVALPIQLHPQPRQRSFLERVRLSVSSVASGISETGTIVHRIQSGSGRLLSVFPPNHAALLSESNLLMNHRQFFESAGLGAAGSATTFVTGPSRTADIEKELVVGVHGPGRLFVILTR